MANGRCGTHSSIAHARVRRIARSVSPGLALDVHFTFNHSTLISFERRHRDGWLRLHDGFKEAPSEVLEAIIRYCFTRLAGNQREQCSRLINGYIERHRRSMELRSYEMQGPPPVPGAEGDIYDLEELLRGVCRTYFRRRIPLQISWSRRVARTIMGQWREMPPGVDNFVFINRLFDDPRVPAFYLEYLIYHEVLHELLPAREQGGRLLRHYPEFREMERRFRVFDEAVRWEHEHVGRLYREFVRRRESRPTG